MPVDRIQPLLNAYADGELSFWARLQIQSHLKTCPSCRAEYTAIQSLSAQARAWRDVAAPHDLKARIESTLSRPFEEDNSMVSHSSVFPRPNTPALRLRTLHWQPLLLAAGSAVVMVIMGWSLSLLLGSSRHPSVTYAEVERAMQTVRAISWTQTETRYDRSERMTFQGSEKFWVRRDQPAIASETSGSSLPQTPDGEYAGPRRTLSDSHGQVNFHVRDGLYYLHPAEDIAHRVQSTLALLSRLQGTGDGMPKRVTLAGRPTLVFRQHFHTVLDAAQMPDPSRKVIDGDDTLWADASTLRVLRKRSDFVFGPDHIIQDATNFQYDTPAPTGVFDMAPPPNARVTEDDGRGNQTVVAKPAAAPADTPAPSVP